jgi:hypothetical protein
MQVLTNSNRNSYGTCHRKFFYQHEICRNPVHEPEALRFGTLTHESLEQWYLNHYKGADERMAAALAAIAANAEKAEADLYQVAMCRAMMRGYELAYGHLEMHVVAVEQEFYYPLYNPKTGRPSQTWELGGKIDAIAIFGEDGKQYIIEHKTTSDSVAPESSYWVKLRIDGQVSAYFPGAKSKGFECDDLLYDVLHKPQVRPRNIPQLDAAGLKQVVDADGVRQMNKDGKTWKQAPGAASEGLTLLSRDETPDEFEARIWEDIQADPDKYYRRLSIVRSDEDMLEYFDDMWAVGREIADAQKSGRFPRNPRSCDNYGLCQYFDVCGGQESIDNPQKFKTTQRHQELVEAAERSAITAESTTETTEET